MTKRGDSGSTVAQIQRQLAAAGYKIDPAEVIAQAFGPSTETAVKAFQTSRGLSADGLVGIMTSAALANPSGIAELPGCLWVPADPTNYFARSPYVGNAYDFIVVHITSGHADPLPVAQMWQQPHHKSSAHLVIGQDGSAIQCVPLRFAAEHAHQANDRSVGIEHCAREPNEPSFPPGDPGLPPSDAQYTTSAVIVAYLLKAAGLPVQQHVTVKGHAEADPLTTHTLCPDGAPWDWARYIPMVQTAYDRISQPPAVA
jgi:N-acetyl-anhydromuramyl-L-alanine amidase AmpD